MLDAGPQLDCEIMRVVFRLLVISNSETQRTRAAISRNELIDIPEFSTDLQQSISLVNHMQNLGYRYMLRRPALVRSYRACFYTSNSDDTPVIEWVAGETEALAIARAALVAVIRAS